MKQQYVGAECFLNDRVYMIRWGQSTGLVTTEEDHEGEEDDNNEEDRKLSPLFTPLCSQSDGDEEIARTPSPPQQGVGMCVGEPVSLEDSLLCDLQAIGPDDWVDCADWLK